MYVNIYNADAANYTFTVMDIKGKTILNEKLNGEINLKFEINLSNQTDGTYFIIYNGDTLLKHPKIVKLSNH